MTHAHNHKPLSIQQNRTLALAALFQASNLVNELAQNNRCDTIAYQALTDSLFVFDPESPLDVYAGNSHGLESGLNLLSQLSSLNNNPALRKTASYALSLLALEKQASKSPQMLETIRSRLQHMQYKQTHFGPEHDGIDNDLANSLSGLYQDTLSTLKFRVQVQGNMEYLTNSVISDRIRALLFSGLRAAMLWRQLGGTKWQLIFSRSEIESICKDLISNPIYPQQH